MAKLHEAIIDILPQEQVKVDNQLVNNVFDHLNLFGFIYNIVCFKVHVCLSQNVFVMQYNFFSKTTLSLHFFFTFFVNKHLKLDLLQDTASSAASCILNVMMFCFNFWIFFNIFLW